MINNLVSRANIQLIFALFTVKSVSKYYTQQHSPSYICFLDASKAFDKINHFKLFQKVLDRKTPIIIVRILLFWYSKQTVCIKWGRSISGFFFCISNGVRQGGILSPKLCSVYIDDLSDKLVKCKVGCYIDNLCMNHVSINQKPLKKWSIANNDQIGNYMYKLALDNNVSQIVMPDDCLECTSMLCENSKHALDI